MTLYALVNAVNKKFSLRITEQSIRANIHAQIINIQSLHEIPNKTLNVFFVALNGE